MAAVDREALELTLGQRFEAGAWGEVAAALVRGYGPEILGFLGATLRDEQVADEVFQVFCEQLLRGLPTFQRKSSFRTWAYTLARNAAYQHRLGRRRRGARELAIPVGSELAVAVAKIRTETAPYVRTETKTRFQALRDALPEDDRTLLLLRVDKGLGFEEIARVMLGEEEPDAAAVKREAARLRKRFQLVKERLVELGRQEGLLKGDDER